MSDHGTPASSRRSLRKPGGASSRASIVVGAASVEGNSMQNSDLARGTSQAVFPSYGPAQQTLGSSEAQYEPLYAPASSAFVSATQFPEPGLFGHPGVDQERSSFPTDDTPPAAIPGSLSQQQASQMSPVTASFLETVSAALHAVNTANLDKCQSAILIVEQALQQLETEAEATGAARQQQQSQLAAQLDTVAAPALVLVPASAPWPAPAPEARPEPPLPPSSSSLSLPGLRTDVSVSPSSASSAFFGPRTLTSESFSSTALTATAQQNYDPRTGARLTSMMGTPQRSLLGAVPAPLEDSVPNFGRQMTMDDYAGSVAAGAAPAAAHEPFAPAPSAFAAAAAAATAASAASASAFSAWSPSGAESGGVSGVGYDGDEADEASLARLSEELRAQRAKLERQDYLLRDEAQRLAQQQEELWRQQAEMEQLEQFEQLEQQFEQQQQPPHQQSGQQQGQEAYAQFGQFDLLADADADAVRYGGGGGGGGGGYGGDMTVEPLG